MRQSSFKLLSFLSRDDLFRHLLGQSDSTNGRQIISTTYWRVCFYVLAMAIRLIHQSTILYFDSLSIDVLCFVDGSELVEHLPSILKLCEWITLNTTDLSQADKSTLFNLCQMPIERLSTPKLKQDLLIHMMK